MSRASPQVPSEDRWSDHQLRIPLLLAEPSSSTSDVQRGNPSTVSRASHRAPSEDRWSDHQLRIPLLLAEPSSSTSDVQRWSPPHLWRPSNTQLDWFTLNGLFQDRSCVAIGECGLNYTAADIEKQWEAFRRQVQMAKLLGKPLVLHLRGGKYEGAVVKEESVYEEAFPMLVGELQLPRAHPLYIHCYVGGWKMCLKFPGKFKRVLFGLTVRSTEHEDFPRIAKGLGFERLALETDAPYLPPPGHNPNHPWLIYHQASLVAQHRNLPVSAVLEGATANVRRFFRI